MILSTWSHSFEKTRETANKEQVRLVAAGEEQETTELKQLGSKQGR